VLAHDVHCLHPGGVRHIAEITADFTMAEAGAASTGAQSAVGARSCSTERAAHAVAPQQQLQDDAQRTDWVSALEAAAAVGRRPAGQARRRYGPGQRSFSAPDVPKAIALRVALTISMSSRFDGLGTKAKASETADKKRDCQALGNLRDDAVEQLNLLL
jgi:hypothetical protein